MTPCERINVRYYPGRGGLARWWRHTGIAAIAVAAACLIVFPRPSLAQSDEWKFLFDGYAYRPWMEEKLNLGMAAARRKDWELAIKHFKNLEADIQFTEPSPVEGMAAFGLGFAYDNAGGRELLAITWYRAYLGSAHLKPWDREERFNKVRWRVKELDDQAEGAVRKLIRIAEGQLLKLAPTQREKYAYIASAQAAIGDFDAAKASLRRACDSIWAAFAEAWQRGYEGAVIDQYSFTKALASIAMSQWKYGDADGALETLDDPYLRCTITKPGTLKSFKTTERLEHLPLFLTGDWSALRHADSSYQRLFSTRDGELRLKIYITNFETMGEFFDRWDDVSPRSFILEDISGAGGGWFFLLDESCYRRGWAHEYWSRVAGATTVPQEESEPCDLLAEYQTDWRVLAKRRESPYPTTTVEKLSELALDMAQVLHFLRARNASLGREEWGWMFK